MKQAFKNTLATHNLRTSLGRKTAITAATVAIAGVVPAWAQGTPEADLFDAAEGKVTLMAGLAASILILVLGIRAVFMAGRVAGRAMGKA